MHTLYFPIRLAPGYGLSLDDVIEVEYEQLVIKISKKEPFVIVEIEGFDKEEEALAFIENLWTALRWVMVDQRLPLFALVEPNTVQYAEDPELAAESLSKSFGIPVGAPVHGLADRGSPCVYPSDMEIRKLFAGELSISKAIAGKQFLESLLEGLADSSASNIDERTDVALDLYSSSYAETSKRAKLQTLVTCLETLSPSTPKMDVAQNLMDKWEKELISEMEQYRNDSAEYASLVSLKRELSFRRGSSLRGRVRSFVLATLNPQDPEEEAKLGKRTTTVYDRRSLLVHEGHLDQDELNEALSDAETIASDVLRALLAKQ